jgi:hypothetical protein
MTQTTTPQPTTQPQNRAGQHCTPAERVTKSLLGTA